MSKKRYLNWKEAAEILEDGGEVNNWHEAKEIQVFKKDLECHDDLFITERTLSALVMRNIVQQVPSGALKADVFKATLATPTPDFLPSKS